MDVKHAIYGRRAVRDYKSQPIDATILRQLIDAAIQAPSAVNRQPWSFTIVRDQTLLANVSDQAKAHLLRSAGHAAVDRYREMLGDPNFHIFYHAPVLVLISAIEPSPWAVEDCSLAAQNLMLAAYAAGLGSCWIGFAQAWLGTPEGKAALKLGPELVPVAPIILGYPTTAPSPVPRKEPVTNWIG